MACRIASLVLICSTCGTENLAGAKFCNGCAAPLGASASSGEVRKIISALFCDLVGSTSLGERHDPEVLRPILDGYFTEMRSAVERHGGRVEKFIGDAVVAVFGLPNAHEDDALRAGRADIEMQERMQTLNEASPIPLAARIDGFLCQAVGAQDRPREFLRLADALEASVLVQDRMTLTNRQLILARAHLIRGSAVEAEAAARRALKLLQSTDLLANRRMRRSCSPTSWTRATWDRTRPLCEAKPSRSSEPKATWRRSRD